VDSGYANREGYLAPYKGTKYHLQEYRNAAAPQGMEETFNYAHSSLRNVIERSFGVLKMKWRMLDKIPSYACHKQSMIIVACCALHNFIRISGKKVSTLAVVTAMRTMCHQWLQPINHKLKKSRMQQM